MLQRFNNIFFKPTPLKVSLSSATFVSLNLHTILTLHKHIIDHVSVSHESHADLSTEITLYILLARLMVICSLYYAFVCLSLSNNLCSAT